MKNLIVITALVSVLFSCSDSKNCVNEHILSMEMALKDEWQFYLEYSSVICGIQDANTYIKGLEGAKDISEFKTYLNALAVNIEPLIAYTQNITPYSENSKLLVNATSSFLSDVYFNTVRMKQLYNEIEQNLLYSPSSSDYDEHPFISTALDIAIAADNYELAAEAEKIAANFDNMDKRYFAINQEYLLMEKEVRDNTVSWMKGMTCVDGVIDNIAFDSKEKEEGYSKLRKTVKKGLGIYGEAVLIGCTSLRAEALYESMMVEELYYAAVGVED